MFEMPLLANLKHFLYDAKHKYEPNLSTKEAKAGADPRIFKAESDLVRSAGAQAPPPERSETANGELEIIT